MRSRPTSLLPAVLVLTLAGADLALRATPSLRAMFGGAGGYASLELGYAI
jgi:hypothetical protein